MTPLPKNKITRAERGKRRRGNTPSLKRNVKQASTPLYKNKIVQKIKLVLRSSANKANSQQQKAQLAQKLSQKHAKKTK